MGEVDSLRLFRERLHAAAGVFAALFECLQGGRGLAAETERAGHLGPVKFEGCAALEVDEMLAIDLRDRVRSWGRQATDPVARLLKAAEAQGKKA